MPHLSSLRVDVVGCLYFMEGMLVKYPHTTSPRPLAILDSVRNDPEAASELESPEEAQWPNKHVHNQRGRCSSNLIVAIRCRLILRILARTVDIHVCGRTVVAGAVG